MEEKERYEWNSPYDSAVRDNKNDDIINAIERLNEQDKRIKELETTNKVLSNELTKNNIMKQDKLETCCGIPIYEIPALKEENQQLKQSQKQLAIDELEKLKDTMFKEAHLSEEITFVEWLYDNYLDNQIKELKGEENE